MTNLLNTLIILAMGALILIILAGFWSMFKGGGNLSQKLMRARVIIQFFAIILLLILAWMSTSGG